MVLKIYDDIIADQQREAHRWCMGTDGVAFSDIDAAVAAIPADDDRIELLIHCCGGLVSEGWAIVDKLRATGKVISATIDGVCASMAVSIYLAASERKAQPHATMHIHKPMIPPYSLPDAYNEDDLKAMASDLERETAKMLDWYCERTGADREVLDAIMSEDRDMDMTEAQALGFVHSVIPPMSASTRLGAKAWNKSNPTNNNMAKNSKAGVINALANLLGVKVDIVDDAAAVNYVLTTADGSELTIDKPEGEPIAVGDAASPDGTFVLEDGRTVIVADGVITEINEPAAEPEPAPEPTNAVNEGEGENGGDDLEALKAENEAVKAENEELKAKVAELEAKLAEAEDEKPSAEDKAVLAKVAKCGGAEWLNSVAKSDYTPARRQTISNNTGRVSATAQRIAELRERANK